MGPTLLFDKSALQALSIDESVWLDQFFLPVICPIFYVETLADLEKAIRAGRTPEQEVGLIAARTPEVHGYPNVFHGQLCVANIQGYPVPLDGRPAIAGGQPVRAGNRTGLKFDVAPEAEAFGRWQEGKFLEIERKYAAAWRASLSHLSFDEVIEELKKIKIIPEKCKTLEEAKKIADAIVNSRDRPFEVMAVTFALLGIPPQLSRPVLERASAMGYPSLASFAPYVAHVLSVEIFFYVAVAASQISKEWVTNKIDLAYLYYLPFCKIFTSGDKLHRRCAPYFLRDGQQFVWAQDLKNDLKNIDVFFDTLPENEKEKGLFTIAGHPPKDGDYLVSKLWDAYLPGWRTRPETKPPKDPDAEKKLVEHLRKFTDAEPLEPDEVDFDVNDPENLALARKVRRRKGKWWQVPKDLKSSDTDKE